MHLSGVRALVVMALLTALVAVGTMVVQIPVPATGGYINFGDTFIFVSALIFGPVVGMVAGGIGSAMADMLSGYAVWAPFTLVVKGLEGLIAGYLFLLLARRDAKLGHAVLAMVAGGAVMVLGYLLSGTIIKGSFAVALTGVPGDMIQAFVSIIVATALYYPIKQVINNVFLDR